jgi:hypothetical protein
MGQQLFRPIINRQSSLHILTFPKKLFTIMMSFIDTKSQLALAHIYKKVYLLQGKIQRNDRFVMQPTK